MGTLSASNLSCLAATWTLSRRARLKHSRALAVTRTRDMMTVKCRVRTLGSHLMIKRLFFIRVRNRYFGLVILSLDSLTVSSSRILIQPICPTGRPKFTALEGLVASAFLQIQGRNLLLSNKARPTLTDLSNFEFFFAVRTPS